MKKPNTSTKHVETSMQVALQKDIKKARGMLFLLAVVLLILFFVSFLLGRYPVPIQKVIGILLSKFMTITPTWTKKMEIAVLNVRLPRILLAIIVGGSLSTAGCTYQSVFKNPMASSDILGASSGACFGAALAILNGASSVMIMLSAFLFSLVTIGIVYVLGSSAKGNPVVNILLAGVIVSSLFSAGTSYIKLVADPTNILPAITYWMMGSLSGATNGQVQYVIVPTLLALLPLLALRWRINLLTLSEEEAYAIGIHVGKLRLVCLLCSTLLTAAAVSVSGMIGWVGLVVPHIGRKLIGDDNRYLIPASTLLGSSFLLLVDNLSRNLLSTEIPIGILTAFVGAPFFLYLMHRREDF